jgi:hypothetical protein
MPSRFSKKENVGFSVAHAQKENEQTKYTNKVRACVRTLFV